MMRILPTPNGSWICTDRSDGQRTGFEDKPPLVGTTSHIRAVDQHLYPQFNPDEESWECLGGMGAKTKPDFSAAISILNSDKSTLIISQ